MADLNVLAAKIRNMNKPASTPSLIPAAQQAPDFASLLPDRPTYTPYNRQEFDSSPRSGPGSELGWTWTPGVRTRQIFDQEQDQKANDVLQQYNLDLNSWKDAVDIAKMNYQAQQDALGLQNQQLNAQGLTPSAYAGDISAQLRQNGALWKQAYDAGDYALADKYHQANEALRQQAGWGSGGADGSLTAGRMSLAGTPTQSTQNAQMEVEYTKAMNRLKVPGYAATEYDEQITGIPKGVVMTPVKVSGGGSGGSSGGSAAKPTQTDRYNSATGEAYQAVTTAINAGKKKNEIASAITSQAGLLQASGVDYADVLKYLETVYNPELAAYEDYLQSQQAAG